MKRYIKMCLLLLAVFLFPLRVSASESVLEKYQDGKVYDITAYGADNTGKRDSSAAVLDALAAAKQDIRKNMLDNKKNAVIYFPGGTYKISTQVKLLAGMILAAEDDTVVNFTGNTGIAMYGLAEGSLEGGTWKGGSNTACIHITRVKKLKIENFTVASGRIGIQIFDSTASLKNVSVSKCTSIGVNLSNGSRITASNCTVKNNGYGYPKKGYLGNGVGVYAKASLTISDSELSDNKECGISVKAATVVMKNCKMHNNGRHGLGSAEVCNITMTKCDIYHNGYIESLDGVTLVDGSKGKFVNCTFRSNAVTGLLVNHGNTNAVIKGCTFKGNVAHNIYSENIGSGKVSITIDSCKFYKCKTSESVRILVNSKSGYSLTLKGANKYYNISPKYAFKIKDKWSYKN